MGTIIRNLLASNIGRWAIAAVIAAILGFAVYKWIEFKGNLRDEGRQECIQKINQATVDQLKAALAEQIDARAELRQRLIAVEAMNADAQARAVVAEKNLEAFKNEREQQAEQDIPYREWRAYDLPSGVAQRLRGLSGSDPRPGREGSH